MKYNRESLWYNETVKRVSHEMHEFRVKKLKEFAPQLEYRYELMDDGGSNSVYLPIMMMPGTTFMHEYGFYLVKLIDQTADKKEMMIIYERTHKI